MVGRKIDEILTEKANSRNKTGKCCLSPFVIPVVSSFKRLYQSRLSRNAIFKGKPLHTIDESNELIQNDMNTLNLAKSSHGEIVTGNILEENDSLLLEIRNLFLHSENEDVYCADNFRSSDSGRSDSKMQSLQEIGCHNSTDNFSDCMSPSFSLIQQFEMAAKVEAAVVLQSSYRRFRDQNLFMKKKRSAIIIQRSFRSWQQQHGLS